MTQFDILEIVSDNLGDDVTPQLTDIQDIGLVN
eukprot:CAMPEP_0113657834 /NCGR_PEP_ID=MMETSP0017_2-20120614/31325_1 /TAXON_ID=2856 /ORGANISM="Cylindrotheca closterium" /LENGTH=32 /DNA_ID=CAMNT_0000571923 /DNA_START=96 /DNA_END=191 /DNA_ORIENTATION=+ /assembly_acc=CAM_ASM_000147